MPNSVMMNSSFNQGGSVTPMQLANQGGMSMPQMISQIRNFKNVFKGNPRQQVMNMVQQGIRSNEQLNQAMSMAQQISAFMK